MAVQLIPLLIGAGMGMGAGSGLYNQYKQRQLYRYQDAGYKRYVDDWNKNVGYKKGRSMRYPELGAPGSRYAIDSHLRQSYASSIGSAGGFAGSALGFAGAAYNRGYHPQKMSADAYMSYGGLYGNPGRGSRRL